MYGLIAMAFFRSENIKSAVQKDYNFKEIPVRKMFTIKMRIC